MTSATLHLTVATPLSVLVDSDDVVALRADDETGAFGIHPGHADFLTVLEPSVVRWRTVAGAAFLCAIGGGVLSVEHGRRVSIACRDAILGDSLDGLEARVRDARARQLDTERRARAEQVRLHARAVRQLLKYLRGTPPSGIGVDRSAARAERSE